MNILDLKRKAAGWMLRWSDRGTDSTGTGPGNTGGTDSGGMGSNNGGGGDGLGDTSGINAQQANAVADQLSVDPMDALMANENAFGTAPSYGAGDISPDGFSYAQLGMLNDLGYGHITGVNPNNPTQSIAEAMAANEVHGWLNQYASQIPAMMGAPIGLTSAFNFAMNFAQNKQSIGQSIAGAALGAAAKSIGVSAATLSSALSGNFGAAAANMASQAALGALASATGLPGSIVGAIAKESGLLGEMKGAISGAVNNATGDLSTGFSAKGFADAIDGAIGSVTSGLGGSFGGEGSSGGEGGAGAGSSGGSEPGVMDFTNPFNPTETLDAGALQQSYQGAQGSMVPVSYGENAADIGPAYDPFQDFISMPVRGTTQDGDDSLKYLRAAEGGSIEDLAEYLRS